MRHAISVGMGFGKHSLEDAITSSQAGDVVVIDPGEYQATDGYSIKNLEIRGNGNTPGDVIIHTKFTVKENGTLKLENLTVIGEMTDNNTCMVKSGAQLIAKRVVFSNNHSDDYPTVYLDGGNAGFTACELKHSSEKGTSLYIAAGGYALASQSDLSVVKVNASRLETKASQIRHFLGVDDHSEVVSDTLYLADAIDDWYFAAIADGSVLTADGLVLPEGNFNAHVIASRINIPQTNIDPLHELTILSEESSDVYVSNAKIKEPQKQTSNPQPAPTDKPTEQPETEETPTEAETPTEEAKPAEKPAIDQLHEMIGLTELKKQIDSFIKVAAFTKQRAEQGAKTTAQSLHSLFLGNPGTGKTTVARIVAKAMFENGVMPKNNYVEVSRQDLVSENVGGTALKTQKVLDAALGGVLFIDEAYSLYQEGGTNWGQEAVDTILKYMEDHRDDLMIIFAGYTKEMQDFMNMNPGLTSRAPNVFTFEDYTPEEVARIGVLGLRSQQFIFDEDHYQEAVKKAFKADVDHSNGRWVRNFNDQLIRTVAMNAMDNDQRDLNTILNADIDDLTGGDDDSKANEVDNLLAELNGMIGLRSVKDYVADLVEQIRVEQLLEDKLPESNRPTYHMVFAGAPGTGKTTVARIIAKLFYNLGILPKDTVSEVSRADLVGRYVGQTEAQTSTAIRNAMGGVLFVDEAYQLTQVNMDNDFGKQAVETFITELENNRDKFVAIFAGYTDEMNQFLEANPGLRSRVPLTLEFEDYTPEEIAEIVVAIVKKDWTFNDGLLKSIVVNKYKQLPDAERSNGRWARNFADKLIAQHKLWLGEHPDTEEVTAISDDLLFDSMSWE